MRYYLDHDQSRLGWVIFEGTSAEDGTVVLELPGIISREVAEKARIALARAKEEGRREVASEVVRHVQGLRLAEGDFA